MLFISISLFISPLLFSFELSENYRAHHTEFEINFIESLSSLSGFEQLTNRQLNYLEEHFDSYVQQTYGSMDRAYYLLAYSVDEYACLFNDLIKLIKVELKSLEKSIHE